LLYRHEGRDRVGALADQIGGLAHDLGAIVSRHRTPDLEAFFRGGQGLVEIGLLGMGDGADVLFSRRIEDGDGLSRSGGTPFAVDI
jgi:hypothetical protein